MDTDILDIKRTQELAERAINQQLAHTDIELARSLQRRIRSARLRDQLLTDEGGCFTSRDVGRALKISHNTVVSHDKAGRIFSVSDRGRNLYPLWQYDEGGKPYPGLKSALQHYSPPSRFMLLSFFLTPHPDAGDIRPIDWLRSRNDEALEDLARFEANA